HQARPLPRHPVIGPVRADRSGRCMCFFWLGLLADPAINSLGKPFSEQSPLSLIVALALAAIALSAFRFACWIAFGRGETEEEWHAREAARAAADEEVRKSLRPERPVP